MRVRSTFVILASFVLAMPIVLATKDVPARQIESSIKVLLPEPIGEVVVRVKLSESKEYSRIGEMYVEIGGRESIVPARLFSDIDSPRLDSLGVQYSSRSVDSVKWRFQVFFEIAGDYDSVQARGPYAVILFDKNGTAKGRIIEEADAGGGFRMRFEDYNERPNW